MKKDFEIQANVSAELRNIPLINANEIGVAVKNGIVTLSGSVDSYPKKIRIEKAIKKLRGVRGIAENIEVVISEDHKKSDTQIAQAVLYALQWHSAVQVDVVSILVEDACVTLEGTVEYDFQRKSAFATVAAIKGVKSIINNIRLSDLPSEINIREKLHADFSRYAHTDANRIKIKLDGRKVILDGTVNSWAEYEEAEHAVWSTPGVTSLQNNLAFDESF